jgi:hypothetical protein
MFGLKSYTIKKGKHYSGFRFIPFFKCKEITVAVNFTDSCRYLGNTVQMSEQINKLCGFGAILHHRNSIRIGWRYDPINDKVDLFTYEYKDSERLITKFDSVRINQTKKIRLKSLKTYYFGCYKWPYFGGKSPAAHDMEIKILFL